LCCRIFVKYFVFVLKIILLYTNKLKKNSLIKSHDDISAYKLRKFNFFLQSFTIMKLHLLQMGLIRLRYFFTLIGKAGEF